MGSQTSPLILNLLTGWDRVRSLARDLPPPGGLCTVGEAVGSSGAAVTAALHSLLPHRLLVAVTSSPQDASALASDLESLLGAGEVPLFPQREALPFEELEPHLDVCGLRVEALEALLSGRSRILVTTLRALQEKAPVPESLADLRLTVRVGQRLSHEAFLKALEARGFQRVALVEEVGQFAVRGGLVDLFSFGAGDPVRVEFWDDAVASIRAFDLFDQRSLRSLDETHVLPVDFLRRREGPAVQRSLTDLLPSDTLLALFLPQGWEEEPARTWGQGAFLREEVLAQGRQAPPLEEVFLPPEEFLRRMASFPRLAFRPDGPADVVLGALPPPPVERDMERLGAFLREGAAQGHRTVILCDNDGQVQRLEDILGEGVRLPGLSLGVGSLAGGFLLPLCHPPLRVLTDHEIFRRPRRLRRRRAFRGAAALESLAQLSPGDYVVHMDHGVGVFRGLERILAGGVEMEVLTIEYAGGDLLRVPVYRLDLVERWVGEREDAEPPKLHRIGGRSWKTLRKKTEQALEAMATELLELYAMRQTAQGFAFSPDSRWQREMESSFLYEDTPDQRRASQEVKRDMELARPMDRLVCGDVGYGKTEIAVRAAFKAVQDGKQVAVLAPTTILAEQHFRTFQERLAGFPVSIAALSRFRTPKEQAAILEGIRSGRLDIVIGTHRLLSPDVHFKDLGLLVVDEEQRFGVRHKERLKALKTSVDVLTLTATPIPRTLHLSLSGLRDLSLIQTPPRDRLPVLTYVLPWSDTILGEALHRELDRGGQVFFLHNRVETIHTAASRIRKLEPQARYAVAHGQMPPRELDEVMRAFVDGEVDVLVCTSIIENGLDVPNANTLIVDGADRFGLAQLYQIRGRVGRSHRQAYCYLVVPEDVGEEAEKRLRVLEHYTELGSGYSVAIKDLELRGAGSLLGSEQSGFAHAVGLDTYLRLLERTVERLRRGPAEEDYPEPEVTLSASAFLPDAYISDAGQKLHLYRRLSRAQKPEEVDELARELRDRYGPVPREAQALLDGARLRLMGRRLGVERIQLDGREGRISFRAGVVPPLARVARALEDRQVDVEVKRLDPLSLVLRQAGAQPLAETLREAFSLLGAAMAPQGPPAGHSERGKDRQGNGGT